MFSPRKMLLFLLLVMPRSDPSSFSGPPGKALILDPGVSLSLCFSAQSRGRVLPDPRIFLSVLACQELFESLYDLSKCCQFAYLASSRFSVAILRKLFLYTQGS